MWSSDKEPKLITPNESRGCFYFYPRVRDHKWPVDRSYINLQSWTKQTPYKTECIFRKASGWSFKTITQIPADVLVFAPQYVDYTTIWKIPAFHFIVWFSNQARQAFCWFTRVRQNVTNSLIENIRQSIKRVWTGTHDESNRLMACLGYNVRLLSCHSMKCD